MAEQAVLQEIHLPPEPAHAKELVGCRARRRVLTSVELTPGRSRWVELDIDGAIGGIGKRFLENDPVDAAVEAAPDLTLVVADPSCSLPAPQYAQSARSR